MSEARRVEVAVCERHGLRYNAAEGRGCVRCRAEAGVAPGTAPAARTPAPGAGRGSDAGASAARQLVLAALLVGGTGALFWTAHQAVLDSFGGLFGLTAEGPGAATDALSMEEETGLGGTPSEVEPAAYPPEDTVAVGPAAQEQQMRELMRQMEEDARIDAEDAARAAERDAASPDTGGSEPY